MDWKQVGAWLKENAGAGAALVGSLLVGNVPGAVAAGVSMVTSVTGESDPEKVLATLQNNPETMLKLRELALKENDSIRAHIQAMTELELKDKQEEHRQQQETIRSGDNSQDEFVRHTRPKMARQSWYATALYIVAFEGLHNLQVFSGGADWELALLLLSPAAAYLGFRSLDKRTGIARITGKQK